MGGYQVYVEDIKKIYGCFRCGVVLGDVKRNEESGLHICGSCGEESVVTFLQALDLLNDQFLQGVWEPPEEGDYEWDIEPEEYGDE